MYIRAAVIIACVFSACAKPPAHVREGIRVSESFSDQMMQTYGFSSLGSGGDFKEGVKGFYADFETVIPYSKADAKNLLNGLVATFLEQINADTGVKPFLEHIPVTSEDISISIAFVDEKRNPRKEFAQIHLIGNKIFYSVYKPETKAYIAIENEVFEGSESLAKS